MSPFGLSGCRETQRLWRRRRFTQQPDNSKRATAPSLLGSTLLGPSLPHPSGPTLSEWCFILFFFFWVREKRHWDWIPNFGQSRSNKDGQSWFGQKRSWPKNHHHTQMTMIHLSAHTIRIQTRSPNKKNAATQADSWHTDNTDGLLVTKLKWTISTLDTVTQQTDIIETKKKALPQHNSPTKLRELLNAHKQHVTSDTGNRHHKSVCTTPSTKPPNTLSLNVCFVQIEKSAFSRTQTTLDQDLPHNLKSLRNNHDLYKVPLFNLEIAQNSQSTEKTTTQHSTTTTNVHKAPAVRTQIRWQNMMSTPTLNILFTTTIHHVCDRRTPKTDLKHCNCQPDHTTTRHQTTKRKCRNTTPPHHRSSNAYGFCTSSFAEQRVTSNTRHAHQRNRPCVPKRLRTCDSWARLFAHTQNSPITLTRTMCWRLWSVNQTMQHASMLSLMSHDADRNHKLTQQHMTFSAWQSPIMMIKRAFENWDRAQSQSSHQKQCATTRHHTATTIQRTRCKFIPKPMWPSTMDTEWTEKTHRLNNNTQDWLIIAKNSEHTRINKMWRNRKNAQRNHTTTSVESLMSTTYMLIRMTDNTLRQHLNPSAPEINL